MLLCHNSLWLNAMVTVVNVYNFGDVRAEIKYTPIKGKSSVTATHDQRTDSFERCV